MSLARTKQLSLKILSIRNGRLPQFDITHYLCKSMPCVPGINQLQSNCEISLVRRKIYCHEEKSRISWADCNLLNTHPKLGEAPAEYPPNWHIKLYKQLRSQYKHQNSILQWPPKQEYLLTVTSIQFHNQLEFISSTHNQASLKQHKTAT